MSDDEDLLDQFMNRLEPEPTPQQLADKMDRLTHEDTWVCSLFNYCSNKLINYGRTSKVNYSHKSVTYFYILLQNQSRRAGIAWEGEAVYLAFYLYFMYSPCLKTSSRYSNVRHYFSLVTFNATNIISRQNKLTLL